MCAAFGFLKKKMKSCVMVVLISLVFFISGVVSACAAYFGGEAAARHAHGLVNVSVEAIF